MKRIILIFTMFLMLIMSACSTNKVVGNKTTIADNNITENTYDLNAVIEYAKCVTKYSDTATVDVFYTVVLGKYEQDGDESNGAENIEWIVLEKKDGHALLLSKLIIDCKQYIDVINLMHKIDSKTINIDDRDAMYDYINQDNESDRKKRDEFKSNIKWENSDLRYWLNNDFINNAFNDEEKSCVLLSNLYNEGNKEWISNVGINTYDSIFCLSQNEIYKYFNQSDMETANVKLATRGSKYAQNISINGYKLFVNIDDGWNKGNSPFWSRTAGGPRDNIMFIDDDGSMCNLGIDIGACNIGVRPAMWVKYK